MWCDVCVVLLVSNFICLVYLVCHTRIYTHLSVTLKPFATQHMSHGRSRSLPYFCNSRLNKCVGKWLFDYRTHDDLFAQLQRITGTKLENIKFGKWESLLLLLFITNMRYPSVVRMNCVMFSASEAFFSWNLIYTYNINTWSKVINIRLLTSFSESKIRRNCKSNLALRHYWVIIVSEIW